MHLVESQPPSVPLEQASYSNLVSRHPMSASLNAPLLAPGSETPDHDSYISSRGVVSSSSHAPSRPQRQRTSSKGGLAGIIQRRKAARRGFAQLDDNDTAEIDAAAKREIMVAWCCRLSLVCSLIDLTVWAAFLAINFHSGVNAFWFQHVKHYNAVSSMADVMAVACVRAVIALASLAFVRSDNDRSNALTFLAYWSSALFFAAVLCKAIIFTGWSNARTCPFFACEIVLSALLFFAQHRMRRGDTTAVYDPAAAEEEEARQTRARANEAAKKRAAEIAAGLEGAELAEHLAKESARAAAAEYVEKSITRATKMSIKKQTMRFREIFLLLQPYFAPEGAMGRLRVAATWMFLIAARAMNIIGPLFIGRVTNILVNDKRIPYFEIACYCGLAFGSTLMRQSQNVVYRKVKQNAFVHVAQFTFRHLHGLSLQWHLNKKMGNVLRSMDRGIASADSVVSVIFMFLFPAIVECSIIFVIFYIHYGEPYLSSIVFAHLVAYFIITVQVTIWRKKYKRATNKHDNEFHDRATDSLINYETVKYFGNEDYEATRYTEAVLKYQSFAIRTQLSLAVLGTLQSFITQLCLCSCMLVSAHRVVSGHITIGQFSSVCAYVVQLFTPLAMLGQNYDMLVQAFVDMANLSELLAEEPDIVDEPNAVPLRLVDPQRGAEIEFRDVVFSYGDHEGSAGLKGISFTIPRGTSTAVVGTTGAGKSTIGRLLFRFYDVKSGQVTIDGVDIRTVTQASLRRTIGVVPQDTVMFNDTLLHNLRYGRMDATLEEVEEACRQAQLLDFILALPAQWETKVGERGLRLSGGEKQRVAIARALLKDPPVVLLDEATSALDTVKEQEIQSALRGLENGRTTLVIAHRLSTVMHAEQIIVLEQGEIIERGSHEALIAMGGKYASLWAQQASKDAEDAVAAATAAIAANAEADGEDEEGGALVTVSTEPNTPSPTATGPTSPVVPDGDEAA